MNRDMKRDNYDEIINGQETYRTIAAKLLQGDSVLIGWTDEEFTHMDILFTLSAYVPYKNTIQGGLRANDLFISIMRVGSFGFDTHNTKHYNYYAEKLKYEKEPEYFKVKLAELFNGVIEYLNNQKTNY